MSPIYGDVTIINGRIINLLVEEDTALPAFNANQFGRLFFACGQLWLNDGHEWVILQVSNTNTSTPLVVTLGSNWINGDLSFNPTDFNTLNNISGLTANDSLYSVIAQLDAAITNVGTINLQNLGDTSFSNLQQGDVVYWTGSDFANISLNDLATARLSIYSTSLKDTQISDYQAGDVLVWSGSSEKLVNRQIMFTLTNTASDSAFAVPHQLGVQFPLVQVINYQTKQSITSGYSVSYDDINNLTVTLDVAAPVVIVVMAMNNA